MTRTIRKQAKNGPTIPWIDYTAVIFSVYWLRRKGIASKPARCVVKAVQAGGSEHKKLRQVIALGSLYRMETGEDGPDCERGKSSFCRQSGTPVLIYLPGVHGDSTLSTSFRLKAAEHLQVVEFVYPRTLTWSLLDYADFVLSELVVHQIDHGWILAESYSSQIAWVLNARAADAGFTVEGLILAGGFVRYPVPALACAAARAMEILPAGVWKALFAVYGA